MRNFIFIALLAAIISGCNKQTNFQIAPSPMLTQFAEQVYPAGPLPEYLRPQMERKKWMNLNGLWEYTLQPINFEPLQGLTKESSWTTHEIPGQWKCQILVPFSIDAPLSGVGHILRCNEVLWYKRSFKVPSS